MLRPGCSLCREFGPCEVEVLAKRPPPARGGTTVESLRKDRAWCNELVMGVVKPMPESEQVHKAVVDDAEEGYMSYPVS